MSKKFEIHGHRGTRHMLPENTLKAYSYALDLGIDAIEVDIALTKDLVPVLHHDRAIKNTSSAHAGQLIRNLTLQEIKKVNVGTESHPESLPTLSEFIELVLSHPTWKRSQANSFPFRMNLEIKTHPFVNDETFEPEVFVKRIREVLFSHEVPHERILFQSFDPRMLFALSDAGDLSEKSFLVDAWSDDLVDVAKELSCQALSPEHSLLSAERCQSILEAGLKLYTWTSNTPEEWKNLPSWGVNGIITDDPQALLNWRKLL